MNPEASAIMRESVLCVWNVYVEYVYLIKPEILWYYTQSKYFGFIIVKLLGVFWKKVHKLILFLQLSVVVAPNDLSV